MSLHASRFVFVFSLATLLCVSVQPASAVTIRGRFTPSLIGGDLTDPENDGDPEADVGYNATFSSSEEPGFGGGEFAFNVFDNQVGGGNMKWCCGNLNNFPVNPISIDATFPQPFVLGQFTITSGNDTPTRDPRVWQILGSNDGINFTPIFSRDDPNTSPWIDDDPGPIDASRDQVLQYDAGTDFVLPAAYNTIRFQTTATGATTGARFQLAELEYFPIPEPSAMVLLSLAAAVAATGRRRN